MADRPANAQALATLVGGVLEGDPTRVVTGLAFVHEAQEGDATFVGDGRHARMIDASKASVIIVKDDLVLTDAARVGKVFIKVKNADHAMLAALHAFDSAMSVPPRGIHPTSNVHPSAQIDPSAHIGAFVSIGARATIGKNCVLHDGVRIYEDVVVGDACVLHSNVVLRERSRLGARVVLHSSVNIGTDGFGYLPDPAGKGIAKVPHIGHVELGDDVEIGANSCVDRGKFGATSIGAMTKIDNLCQIGHNVRIGRACVVSGLSGIAGSTTIGDGCRIGGACRIRDHLTIGNGVSLAGGAGVMHDVPDGASWAGTPAQELKAALREWALIRKLPQWHQMFKHLVDLPKAP